MVTMSFDSNFDPKCLRRKAQQAAARQLDLKCKTADAPYGGMQVTIERSADGALRKILVNANANANAVQVPTGLLA